MQLNTFIFFLTFPISNLFVLCQKQILKMEKRLVIAEVLLLSQSDSAAKGAHTASEKKNCQVKINYQNA